MCSSRCTGMHLMCKCRHTYACISIHIAQAKGDPTSSANTVLQQLHKDCMQYVHHGNMNTDMSIHVHTYPYIYTYIHITQAEGDPACSANTILQQLHKDSRHYIHQGDIVPRLLGPKSCELLQKLTESIPAAATATELIGKYAPVGSFRVVYSEGSRQSERHRVRVVSEGSAVMGLLEPAPLIYLTLAVHDHASTFYRDKLNSACVT
jgi:hypothetical protein